MAEQLLEDGRALYGWQGLLARHVEATKELARHHFVSVGKFG